MLWGIRDSNAGSFTRTLPGPRYRHLAGVRAEPAAVGRLRTSADYQRLKRGPVLAYRAADPEFAASPPLDAFVRMLLVCKNLFPERLQSGQSRISQITA